MNKNVFGVLNGKRFLNQCSLSGKNKKIPSVCTSMNSAHARGHIWEGRGPPRSSTPLQASVSGAAAAGPERVGTNNQPLAAPPCWGKTRCSQEPPRHFSLSTTWPPTAWTSDLRCCRAPTPRMWPQQLPRTCRIQVPEVNTPHAAPRRLHAESFSGRIEFVWVRK